MVDYLSDGEQEEALRRWWQDNWRWIVSGVVLGLAVLGGWQYWQQRTLTRAEGASLAYRDLATALASGDRAKADALVVDIDKQYQSSPYADQAHLLLAQANVATGKFEQAASELKWVLDHSADESLQQVARLRLARVQIQLGHHDEALALLVNTADAFAAQVHEIRGDALLAKGDSSGAQQAYRLALDAAKVGDANTQLLDLKLQDIQLPSTAAAVVPVTPAAAVTAPPAK
ncbi:MAG: tetratricopeptide repeat protein [Candidatus Obscuribacterales bacterium]|nr:tetratricopeptide repeat protein [Steroidobacteraceae bacterium]